MSIILMSQRKDLVERGSYLEIIVPIDRDSHYPKFSLIKPASGAAN